MLGFDDFLRYLYKLEIFDNFLFFFDNFLAHKINKFRCEHLIRTLTHDVPTDVKKYF